jgi:hypothetical protein
LETQKKKNLHGEIEMETKLKMKIIPRSTSEALKFLRQVRFLPDFDPDRASHELGAAKSDEKSQKFHDRETLKNW